MNVPYTIPLIYKALKGTINEFTLLKLYITAENTNNFLKETICECQLEQKHGGCAPNKTKFWPPDFKEEFGHDPFFIEQEGLAHHNRYSQMQKRKSRVQIRDEEEGQADIPNERNFSRNLKISQVKNTPTFSEDPMKSHHHFRHQHEL